MNVVQHFSSSYVVCDSSIQAFGHTWLCAIPPENFESATSLPPPYGAFGGSAQWKLIECRNNCKTACHITTIQLAKQHIAHQELLHSQQHILFGVTRNKKIASAYRLKRAKDKVVNEDSEEEDDIVVVSDSDSDSESSASSVESSASEDKQEDEDVEEEEEEEEEDDE